MKKIIVSLVLIIGLVAWVIILNIFSRHTINFNQSCISYNLGENSYDVVNVQIKGEIRKKFFEDQGEVDLVLQIGDTKYPINTEKMKAIESRKKVTFDPNDITSVPTVDYMQTYSIYRNDYIVIPIAYFYWNDRYQETYRKDHGTLYISKNGNTILYAQWKDTGSDWSWSFNQGYPIIVSSEDIMSSLDTIEEHFGWNVQPMKDYYEQSNRN